MKLHLSKSLRAAIMAAFALAAPLTVTLFSGATIAGVCALSALAPQAQAADHSIKGGTLLNLADGLVITEAEDEADAEIFHNGDNIAFSGDTRVTLADNVNIKWMLINKDANVIVRGDGNVITGDIGVAGTLTLRDVAIADKDEETGLPKVKLSGDGTVILRWGNNTDRTFGSGAKDFKGVLRMLDSTYTLTASESSYRYIELCGASTLRVTGAMLNNGDNGVEVNWHGNGMGVLSVGDSTIHAGAGDEAAFIGELTGHGTITKTGSGTVTFDCNHLGHTGNLIIEDGTVRWSYYTDDDVVWHRMNELGFASVTVVGEGVFEDGHIGMNMKDHTAVILKDGGTLRSFKTRRSMYNDPDSIGPNYYKSLAVDTLGYISHAQAGDEPHAAHRFGLLTRIVDTQEEEGEDILDEENPGGEELEVDENDELLAGGDEAEGDNPDGEDVPEIEPLTTLTVRDFNPVHDYVEFDRVEDFHGVINTEEGLTAPRTLFRDVHMEENHTLTVEMDAGSRVHFNKTGPGAMIVNGAMRVDDTMTVAGGSMEVRDNALAEVFDFTGGSVSTIGSMEKIKAVPLILADGGLDGGGLADLNPAPDPDNPDAGPADPNIGNTPQAGLDDTYDVYSQSLHVSGRDTQLTVKGAVVLKEHVHIDDGTVTIEGRQPEEAVEGAAVEVPLGAEIVHGGYIAGGKTTVTGDMVLRHGLDIKGTAGVVLNGSINSLGAVKIQGNGRLHVVGYGEGEDRGTSITDAFIATGHSRAQVDGDITTQVFDARGHGVVRVEGTLTVTKVLYMDYNGSLELEKPMQLEGNVALIYAKGYEKRIELTGDNHRLNHLFVDVSDYTAAEIKKGVNLGIPTDSVGYYEKLLGYGGLLKNPKLEIIDGYLHLKADGKKPTVWDPMWGKEEYVTAPEKLTRRTFDSEKVGLFTLDVASSQYDDGYYVQVNAYGDTKPGGEVFNRENYLYGGGYGTWEVSASARTMERQVWLLHSGGDFEMLAGGSFTFDPVPLPSEYDKPIGPLVMEHWNFTGDSHIHVKPGSKAGTVVGGNVTLLENYDVDEEGYTRPLWIGDGYITINSSNIRGSVIGGGIGIGSKIGDTWIYVHKTLNEHEGSRIPERTTTDTVAPPVNYVSSNIVGDFWHSYESKVTGDVYILVDTTDGATFTKGIFGGSLDSTTVIHDGDTLVEIRGTHCDFNGTNPAARHDDAVNTPMLPTGHEGENVIGPETTVYEAIAGGHGFSRTETQIGDSGVELRKTKGGYFNMYLTGGSHSGRNVMQEGNSHVLIDSCKGSTYYRWVTGGHANHTANQLLTGNSDVTISGTSGTFHGYIVGGHAKDCPMESLKDSLRDPNIVDDELADADEDEEDNAGGGLPPGTSGELDQDLGHSESSHPTWWLPAVHLGGEEFVIPLAVGRHPNPSALQRTVGNTSVHITKSGSSQFNERVVGGHAILDTVAHNTATQVVDGDTYVVIDGGTFGARVIGGTMLHQQPEPPHGDLDPEHHSTITGRSFVTISGGRFNDTVQGGCYHFSDPVPNVYLAHHGGVLMNLTGGDYRGIVSIEGGYDVMDHHILLLEAHVGDITINMSNVKVSGIVYGGSCTDRDCDHDDEGNPIPIPDGLIYEGKHASIYQGNITLNLYSGTYLDHIFAAGYQGGTRVLLTDSTTVAVSSKAVLGTSKKMIGICGGYNGGNGSLVSGPKTLRFIDPVKYTNLSNAEFTYFDTVYVEEGGDVTLNQTMQLLTPENRLAKTGLGTLRFSKAVKAQSSSVDAVTVREGTLGLAAYTAGSTDRVSMIERLSVSSGATLDISAGYCGIGGTLMLEQDSGLMIREGQGAARLSRLIWGRGGNYGGKVSVIMDQTLPEAGEYTIELFSGLSKDQIDGLALTSSTYDGQAAYVADAMDYINLFDKEGNAMGLSGANLCLKSDGTLLLTGEVLRCVFWEAESGQVWNTDEDTYNWSMIDGTEPAYAFHNNDIAVFSDNEGEPHVVTVEGAVNPNSVKLINGDYLFVAPVAARDGEEENGDNIGEGIEEEVVTDFVSVRRNMSLTNAKAQFDVPVEFDAGHSSLNIDSKSSLTLCNSIAIHGLTSQGVLDLGDNDLTIGSKVVSGGTVIAHDVTLGGDSEFAHLVANDVKGNEGHLLTLGGDSTMVTLDGGELAVTGGETSITTTGATTLDALHGSGTLSTNQGKLVLKGASAIGNLNAPELTIFSNLDVAGNMHADDVTFGDLVITTARPMVQVHSMTGNAAFHLDENTIKQPRLWGHNNVYMLLTSDKASKNKITINGVDYKDLSSTRYKIGLHAEEDKIYIKTDVATKDYYARNACSANGREGARLLDNLYMVDGLLNVDSDVDWHKLMLSMDQMLMKGNRAGADELAAAATGASYAALGSALQDDVYRQLRAIRNRTTTMGLSGSDDMVYDNLPAVNAWVNAEGHYGQLKQDTTEAGYTLSSWGATVGGDVDITSRFTAGLAVTAMYGKFSSEGPDTLKGDMDTMYATAFARYMSGAWVHTFVATAGTADFSLNRTVETQLGNYGTTVDTDGTAFGFMYEVGRVIALNRETGTCLEPVFNIAWTQTSISSMSETGSAAGVDVDSMSSSAIRLGLGARVQTTFGQTVFNHTSILEARVLAKAYAGDTEGEADVAMQAAPGFSGTLKGAKAGTVGLEAGAGLTIPVSNKGAIFADIGVDVSGGYTNVNGTVGFRLNF